LNLKSKITKPVINHDFLNNSILKKHTLKDKYKEIQTKNSRFKEKQNRLSEFIADNKLRMCSSFSTKLHVEKKKLTLLKTHADVCGLRRHIQARSCVHSVLKRFIH
jgi:hypothetical protein